LFGFIAILLEGIRMTIAKTVVSSLERHGIPYDVISHPHSLRSGDTAKAAAVAPAEIAKPVILADDQGYVMAVVPGDDHVDVDRLSHLLGRRLRLVNEGTLAHLFTDCELGAIPPLGPAYGLATVVADHVLDAAHVCFVAGDHDELVRVDQASFRLLIEGARHAPIGCAAHGIPTPPNAHGTGHRHAL
jgi:Ala-tRNA(Pro) deacylase